MDTIAIIDTIIDDIVEMNDLFLDIAAGDGLAPLFVLIGTIFIVFTLGVFGFLTLGAASSLVRSP